MGEHGFSEKDRPNKMLPRMHVRLNELSTPPGNVNGEQSLPITHPFHPLSGQTFALLAALFAVGEERIFFCDPQTHEIRSLLLAWTSLALPDHLLVIARGKRCSVL